MSDQTLAYEEYAAAVQTLAEAAGATPPGTLYADADAWHDAFDNGLKPAEAWAQEQLAAKECQ